MDTSEFGGLLYKIISEKLFKDKTIQINNEAEEQ